MRWWYWPLALLALAAATWAASLAFEPSGDGLAFRGTPLTGGCAFRDISGYPCPNCGMTRSFAWAARGGFGRAWAFSPAGLALFAWITLAGAIGAVRLVTRARIPVSRRLLGGWIVVFLAGYTLAWLLRLGGINALP